MKKTFMENKTKIGRFLKSSLFTLALGIVAFASIPSQDIYANDADGNIVIVIDPGHGGDDPGKIGYVGGGEVHEDAANYGIAVAMKNELEKYAGVKVYLTRPEDSWFTNTGRAMVAAELNADFLICVHNNSGTETSEGAICYTSLLPLYSGITADMGNNILENLSQLGITNNGIQTRSSTDYAGEDYYTIMAEGMRAGVPTVLVEHCFMSNQKDILFLADADGRLSDEKLEKLGQADAQAVVKYFGLEKNTAIADSLSTIKLEKGYSVEVKASQLSSGSISWVSSDESVIKFDEYGLATAVNSGTAKVMYSYPDNTSGYLTIEVAVPSQVALVGAIDPTFYKTAEEFKNITLSNAIANVIYSDGSVIKVIIDSIAEANFDTVGLQDIKINYGALTGKVRIFYSPEGYQPEEVTSRAEVEVTSEAETQISETLTIELATPTTQETREEGKHFDIMMVIKLVAGFIVVVIFGTLIYIVESNITRNRKNNRKNNRRNRY